jgi:hypothetical protein
MENRERTTYDVYLSHSMGDAEIASKVAYECLRNGLGVYQVPDMIGADTESAMREALAECRAVVLVVPTSGPSNWQIVEYGAARGWDKPVYAIAADASTTRLPHFLSHVPLYPIGRVDEVIRAVKLIDREFDDEDRALLAELYAEMAVPLDVLARGQEEPGELARSFNAARRKNFSEDRLLYELYRLRKQGKLPRSRPTKPARTRSHPG